MIAEVEQRTPDLPVHVIAGSQYQARDWAAREGLKPDRWRYVPDRRIENLHGLKNIRIVWVGTFYDRRDFNEISEFVDARVRQGWFVVDRNEVQNKGSKTRPKTEPEAGTETGPLS